MKQMDNHSIHYEASSAVWKLSDIFLQMIPFEHNRLVFCCIGTDRSTGDALGPLIGSQLVKSYAFPFDVIGTLEEPLHALNLMDTFNDLQAQEESPFIIAIDACLSEKNRIGNIIVENGPLFPGKAVKKQLPPIGDISIKGVVNIGGFMEAQVLQNTRLHLTYTMSEKIARSLQLAWQRHLTQNKHTRYNQHHTQNTWKQIGYSNFR